MIHMTVTLWPESDAVRHAPGSRGNGPRIVGRVPGPLCPTWHTVHGPLCRPAPPCPALLSGDSRRSLGVSWTTSATRLTELTEQDAPPRENAKSAESPYFSRILAFPTKMVGFDNVHFVTFDFLAI